ncbi:MAG: serine hydrolase [Pseudoflavonifractor sp.]|nr:serine hydrolase [Pseudoflavonifractor sp.]
MTVSELSSYLRQEIDAFPGQTALLVSDPLSPESLHAWQETLRFPAASTIKTPILLTALEQVRQGMLSLTEPMTVPPESVLPDTEVFDRGENSYSLWELLYWMIVESDNTATNVILDALGFDAVNEYCAMILGLENTLCQRKMLDFAAAGAGLDNFTSAADQRRLFSLLQGGQVLNPGLRKVALSILSRQRSQDCMLRYIPDAVEVAHKTGGLDGVAHDCGLFLLPRRPFFLGIFTWDGPSPDGDPGQKRYIGRLSKAIYDVYKEV